MGIGVAPGGRRGPLRNRSIWPGTLLKPIDACFNGRVNNLPHFLNILRLVSAEEVRASGHAGILSGNQPVPKRPGPQISALSKAWSLRFVVASGQSGVLARSGDDHVA